MHSMNWNSARSPGLSSSRCWPRRILTGLLPVCSLGVLLTSVVAPSGARAVSTDAHRAQFGGATSSHTSGPERFVQNVPVQRIYGADAIATSIAISLAEFPASGSAKAVVLARSDFFADALAGGPLAASVGGPLLTTPGAPMSSALDPRVQGEIQRVLPAGATVYILGGDLAISPQIDSTLQGLGYTIVRIAGSNEYATAVDIAQVLSDPSTIFEATGLTYQDALSAVPAAIEKGGAILLTDGSTQAPETASYLAAHQGDTRYAIGGTLAAAGADPSATAVSGQDLYGTSAAVATTFFQTATAFGAATGASFSDALSGGVFMGAKTTMGPILIVQPSGPLPAAVATYLSSSSTLAQGYLFGGQLAVGDDVAAELAAPTSSHPAPVRTVTSSNWSGYVIGSGPYTSVTGTFSVPSIQGGTSSSSEMAAWVGIDGAGNQSLIQAGVGELVDPNNTNNIVIFPWWEILPAPATPIFSVSVAPGDQVTVSINDVSGPQWSITLMDDTNGESFTTAQTYHGPGSTAEWIVEAPTVNNRQTALAPYSPAVSFSRLAILSSPPTLTRVVMKQNGQQVSTPSALTSNGFNVGFGSATPSAP